VSILVFDNSQPIYRQIVDDFKKMIVRDELKQGEKIPSQREYAQNVRVNPNTVQRAYREMESMQIVETLRGQGTFVCASLEMKDQLKQEMAQALLENFISKMREIGYADEDTIKLLKHAMEANGGVGIDSI